MTLPGGTMRSMSATPFPLAVRTKSARLTSRYADLVVRMMLAVSPTDITSAG